MNTSTDLVDYLTLPNHYLQQLFENLETLAKKAIDDGDLHSGRRLLSLIICIQEMKQKPPVAAEEPVVTEPVSTKELAADKEDTARRPRYKQVGYDEATKEMRDAILKLVNNNLLNLEVDISSRSFYSIIERHHLSNIEPSKLDTLTLPMSESRQDRPRWKEAVTQALVMLMEEDYLTKPGRYTYTWTAKAKERLVIVEEPVVEPTPPVEELKAPPLVTKESLTISEFKEVPFPQPFAAFSGKPRVYESNGVGGVKRDL